MSYQNQPPPPAGFYPGGFPQQPGAGYPPPPGTGYPPPYGGAPGGGFMPPPAFHMPPPDMSNAESGYGQGDFGAGFSDKSIRMAFIRKVYGILMCQIAVTVSIISIFTFSNGTKLWVQNNPSIFWVAFIFMFVTLIVLTCCGEVRRKAPMNFVCLGIFTLAESFLLGVATSAYRKEEVFWAALFTLIVVLALTMFAFQTKIDFTAMGGILFVAVIILMIFGIVCMFFPGKTMTLVYASLGALLFSVYIVYDTQIMLGGDHKYSISPEEYVFASLNLYMDIVNLFIYILTIIGASRD
nr:NMDA receptor 2 [Matsumurasca onukii]